MAEFLHRHDLAFVDPAAWRTILAARPDLDRITAVACWADAGRPLVVRRRSACDPDGMVALGLPLPPALGKQRIAVTLDPAAIRHVDRFPALRTIAGAAPAHWNDTIASLLRLAAACGIEPLVFGSFAWSILTGLDYLSPTSDLDLLWPAAWGQDFSALLAGLPSISRPAPMRIDGEILDPEGSGVDWRELASGMPEVLVKGLASVDLIPAIRFGHDGT